MMRIQEADFSFARVVGHPGVVGHAFGDGLNQRTIGAAFTIGGLVIPGEIVDAVHFDGYSFVGFFSSRDENDFVVDDKSEIFEARLT